MADRPQLATGAGNPVAVNQNSIGAGPRGPRDPMIALFSTMAGEFGAADAERDVRGFALKFYTEGDRDLAGNSSRKS